MLRNIAIAFIALVVVIGVVVSGVVPRMKAAEDLRGETAYLATPVVAVIHPRHGAPVQEITLPASIQAFADAPIYARTNGYLRKWYVDIGTDVKSGQLLAEIDTPEIDRQVEQARADFATAKANLSLAEVTDTRYQNLLKSDSVSKQEVDNADHDLAAKRSVLESADSNLKRLEELQSFQKILAPFDGVITARNTDVGALISSGGGSKELFHIASTDRVRIYVNVPQAYSRAARPGLTADLTLAEFPGRRFKANLTRTAETIDPAAHTLLVELEANNATGELLPGAFAEVHLKLPSPASTFVLPVTAILFRSEGVRIAKVENGNRAELVEVSLGRDFGNEVEVVSGLNGSELVMNPPPDSIVSGETVRVAQTNGEKP